MFAEAFDPYRTVAPATGQVGIGHDDCRSPDARHDDLQHVQRVGDDRTGQNVIDGERLVLPDRTLGVVGIDPGVDDDLGHRAFVVAVDRGVALSHLAVGPFWPRLPYGISNSACGEPYWLLDEPKYKASP